MKVFNALPVSTKAVQAHQKLLRKMCTYSLALQLLIILIIILGVFKIINSQIWNTASLSIALAMMILMWIVVIGTSLKIQQALVNLDKMVFFAFVLPFVGIAVVAVQAYKKYAQNPYDQKHYYDAQRAPSMASLERAKITLEDDLQTKKITKQQYNQTMTMINKTIQELLIKKTTNKE